MVDPRETVAALSEAVTELMVKSGQLPIGETASVTMTIIKSGGSPYTMPASAEMAEQQVEAAIAALKSTCLALIGQLETEVGAV